MTNTVFSRQTTRWIRKPLMWSFEGGRLFVTTEPGTDLWQRTYYGFRNDNAPCLVATVEDELFSFVVRTEFPSVRRFDQCGVVVYQDSDNWLKASVEYEDGVIQRLGSVVTNRGYSDWATTDIPAEQQVMWYRLSRRWNDFLVESSLDGRDFRQMRVAHLDVADGPVNVGVYAASPEESSFVATFTDMGFLPCAWKAHE